MRYLVTINVKKMRQYKLTPNLAALMDLLSQLASWADIVELDGEKYYHISRGKVIAELPDFYRKPDTVYRAYVRLDETGLVVYRKAGKRDLICLSQLGKQWNKLGTESEFNSNSELSPKKLGTQSELAETARLLKIGLARENSEPHPTYNITTTNDNEEGRALDFLQAQYPVRYEAFLMKYRSQVLEWDKLCADFNDIVDEEKLPFEDGVLFARWRRFTGNWMRVEQNARPNFIEESGRAPYLTKIS